MANCNNGQTHVLTCIPSISSTAESATYVIDLIHYTCGNKKICANGFYPIDANLNYKVIDQPQSLGNDIYNVDLLITGQVTYMPYRYGQNQCGCSCSVCPVSENIWCTVSVPWSAATAPVVTAGNVVTSPTNLRDCCNVTNAMSITTSFNLATA